MVGNLIENIKKGDRQIWGILLFLSALSLWTVYSATRSLAYREQGGNTEYYLFKHMIILVLGLVIAYLVQKIDHKYFDKIATWMLFASVPLLVYTMLLGQEANDAKRWITLPLINISFQSSDFAKLALIMYTSRTLAIKQGVIKSFKEGFLPVMVPIAIICGLIMKENMSTALILFMTNIIILFLGRVNMKYIFSTIGIGLLVGITVIVISAFSKESRYETWKGRINDYIHADPENPTYQVMHSKMAIAKGGLIRFAPGKSTQSNYLPESYSDFIFATIIEEYGMMGGAAVIFVYLLLLYRIIKIVQNSNRIFSALMALGLGMSIVIQAFINMGVAVNLLPVTGLTLPFVSMGGSSIWFNGFAMGIILSVSRHIQTSNTTNGLGKQKPSTELNV
ncbi:MAG: putative lipid II flippase FtsW [Chitinophagales bacterium]|nr:putative lipid II flippase FtsW [Chitinophagales bacterium]MCZ2394537.1 putative lipid II flippase FtsW [Chitinophagales bacterium]